MMYSAEECETILKGLPPSLLQSIFINLPVPAGLMQVVYDVNGVPVDLKFLAVSKGCCQDGPINRAFFQSKRDFGEIMGKTILDLNGPVEEVARYAAISHGILQRQETVKLKVPVENTELCAIGFPVTDTVCGFMHSVRVETDFKEKVEELTKSSQALHLSEQRFQKLIDSNILGIMICKLNGELIQANSRFLSTIEYSEDEFKSLKWGDISPADWLDDDDVRAYQLLKQGYVCQYERELLNKNGERIPVEAAAFVSEPRVENPSETVVISYFIDISARKQVKKALIVAREEAIRAKEEAIAAREEEKKAKEQALNASKAKSLFVSTMSHELRTPLAGMLSAQYLLLDSILDPDQRDLVEASIRSGQGLMSLLGDVLDLAKIEAGKVSLKLAPFDLRYCVEDCVFLVGELAARKGLVLATFFDESLEEVFASLLYPPDHGTIPLHEKAKRPLPVISDMQRLRQVIINLVGNSIKFTNHGGVVIKVSAMPRGLRLREFPETTSVQEPSSPSNKDQSAAGPTHIHQMTPWNFPATTSECAEWLQSPPPPYLQFLSSAIFKKRAYSSNDVDKDEAPTCDPKKLRILIEVIDTGGGIPLDKQKGLFQPFSQLDTQANRRFEGAGLGLSICKQLVDLLDGSIHVISDETGSKFFFDFAVVIPDTPLIQEPLQIPTNAMQKSIVAPAISSLGNLQSTANEPSEAAPILIDPLLRIHCLMVLSKDVSLCSSLVFLKKHNISFSTVFADQDDALENIKKQKFDVIVMCMHTHNTPILNLLAKMANEVEAEEERWIYCPIVLLGFKEGIAARRFVPKIHNLRNIVTAYKSGPEHKFLAAVARAYLNGVAATSSFEKEVEEEEGPFSFSPIRNRRMSIASSTSSSESSSSSSSADEVPPELFRIHAHVSHTLSQVSARMEGISTDCNLAASFPSMGRPKRSCLLATEIPSILAPILPPETPKVQSLLPESSPNEEKNVVLVAEDNPLIVRVTRKQIETKFPQAEVLIAENGVQAIDAAVSYMKEQGSCIPLILMDVMMPEMDGIEATRKIRLEEKIHGFDTKSFIVALTADASSKDLCLQAGMDEFVSKPMTVGTLQNVFEAAKNRASPKSMM